MAIDPRLGRFSETLLSANFESAEILEPVAIRYVWVRDYHNCSF